MLTFILLGVLLPSAHAFSFNFTSTPKQCGDLSIAIAGAGSPPYSVLIIPFGPSPLSNNNEVRTIFSVQFNGSDTEASFPLKYPGNSQFVAVVSDSTGFGTGGTSVAATVLGSDDSSCYDASNNVQPGWVFSIVPANQIVQCTASRLWWDPSTVQGTPSFHGVIPGGQSFTVPQGPLSTVPEQGYGFSWTPDVRTGTTVLLVGGDNRGPGTGGSGLYIVSQGSDSSCLNSTSPSSTPGSPAGGSYPTSTNGSGTGGSNGGGSGGSGTNVGAIVGGVIGGVVGGALLVLLVLYFLRRHRKTHKSQKERPVDLLHDPSPSSEDTRDPDGELPQYYQPAPFVLPAPTVVSSTGADESSALRPGSDRRHTILSQTSASELSAWGLGVPDVGGSGSTTTRSMKSRAPPSLRPVNIVQHEDAGPPGPPPPADEDEEPETIELPPAYTNIRRADEASPPEVPPAEA